MKDAFLPFPNLSECTYKQTSYVSTSRNPNFQPHQHPNINIDLPLMHPTSNNKMPEIAVVPPPDYTWEILNNKSFHQAQPLHHGINQAILGSPPTTNFDSQVPGSQEETSHRRATQDLPDQNNGATYINSFHNSIHITSSSCAAWGARGQNRAEIERAPGIREEVSWLL